jgi:hypothetical protein
MQPKIINLPTYGVVNKEEYVVCELTQALTKEEHVILDLGPNFVYNSTIMSLVLIHRDKITLISSNTRLRTIIKILKAEDMICVHASMDEYKSKCQGVMHNKCTSCNKGKYCPNKKGTE